MMIHLTRFLSLEVTSPILTEWMLYKMHFQRKGKCRCSVEKKCKCENLNYYLIILMAQNITGIFFNWNQKHFFTVIGNSFILRFLLSSHGTIKFCINRNDWVIEQEIDVRWRMSDVSFKYNDVKEHNSQSKFKGSM